MIIGFTWATGASVNFMSELLPEDRKAGGGRLVWGVGLGWVPSVLGGFGLEDFGLEVNSSSEFFLFVVCLGILFSFC